MVLVAAATVTTTGRSPQSSSSPTAATSGRISRAGSSIPSSLGVVPEAALRSASTAAEEQLEWHEGLVLAYHWLNADGSAADHVPDEQTIVWPAAIVPWSITEFHLRISTSEPPARVEIRSFPAATDSSGAPLREGTMVSCQTVSAVRSACSWATRAEQVTIDVERPADRAAILLVLYAEWYIPMAKRSADELVSPIISASWGWKVSP